MKNIESTKNMFKIKFAKFGKIAKFIVNLKTDLR